jgi:hypothetical protein
MITGRPAASYGKQRTCPHCKAVILASATVCPACRHHLQFHPTTDKRATAVPLKVEGSVRHPASGEPWEYSVVVAIRNERGEEITRHVVGVGALQPSEARVFSLAVEVFGSPASMAEAAIVPNESLGDAIPKAAESPAPKSAPDLRPHRPASGSVAQPAVRSLSGTPLTPLNPPGLRPPGGQSLTSNSKPGSPPRK